MNLSNEKDSKILELEETLDNSVQEYENQLNAMQTVFKKKLAGYKQFSLPYELDRDQLKHNLNEHCSDEIVQAIKQIVSDGFKNNKSLANVMNYVRQKLMDTDPGSQWLCLFMPFDVKYSYSLAKYRFLRLAFERKDQKYTIILA